MQLCLVEQVIMGPARWWRLMTLICFSIDLFNRNTVKWLYLESIFVFVFPWPEDIYIMETLPTPNMITFLRSFFQAQYISLLNESNRTKCAGPDDHASSWERKPITAQKLRTTIYVFH